MQETSTTLATHPTEQAIEALGPWFHNLHLPGGRQTRPDHPLGDFPRNEWTRLQPCIPGDLTGKRALDIGCNAGFYSFELARRGAEVLGLDVEERYLRQARWAARELDLEDRVRFRTGSVYRLHELGETFDVVIFMGVFYHLRYPVLGLDLAVSRLAPGGVFVFQSLAAPGDEVVEPPADLSLRDRAPLVGAGWPRMSFIERRMTNDPTNWWAPNRACVEALLRSCGLRVRSRPGSELYVCERGEVDPELAAIARDQLQQVVGGLR